MFAADFVTPPMTTEGTPTPTGAFAATGTGQPCTARLIVRTIAGTLVEVGRGKRDPAWVADVIASRDRKQAGQTAPPQGLALLWVAY